MEQKHLSNWLKLILIGTGICGLILYAVAIPLLGESLRAEYPEYSHCFWPWLAFIWATGIPCLIALFCSWKIAVNIGNDQSFTDQNASLLKTISILAAADAGFFFLGNIAFLFLNMTHISVVIASFGIVFVGVAASVASAALSHLVKKAAVLQEQSDLTI